MKSKFPAICLGLCVVSGVFYAMVNAWIGFYIVGLFLNVIAYAVGCLATSMELRQNKILIPALILACVSFAYPPLVYGLI